MNAGQPLHLLMTDKLQEYCVVPSVFWRFIWFFKTVVTWIQPSTFRLPTIVTDPCLVLALPRHFSKCTSSLKSVNLPAVADVVGGFWDQWSLRIMLLGYSFWTSAFSLLAFVLFFSFLVSTGRLWTTSGEAMTACPQASQATRPHY